MIRKANDTMFRGQAHVRRHGTALPWDSEWQVAKAAGKYVREKSGAPYNSRRWRRLAAAFIAEHPLCAECARHGVLAPAECVDHVDPWPICADRFFDRSNLQALCNRCNASKGARDRARIAEWKRSGGGRGPKSLDGRPPYTNPPTLRTKMLKNVGPGAGEGYGG